MRHFKSIIIIAFLVSFITLHVDATIWRVNNNTNVDADFTNLRQVNDSSYVLAGDTVLVEGSAINYGYANMYKPLYIFGTGYFLNENPKTQANPSTAKISDIDFEVGSEGSVLAGFEVTGSIDIYASDVVIKRNYIYGYCIDVNDNKSNVLIIQNYISSSWSTNAIFVDDGCSNIFIQNNFISLTTTTTSDYPIIRTSGTGSAIVSNNVIDGTKNIDASQSVFSNNIIGPIDGLTGSNNQFSNNIFATEIIDTSNHPDPNLVNVDLTTVFDTTCATCQSPDGKFQIFDLSVAADYGIDSVDCGMYGGVNPYILSGTPEIPSIYYFNAPTTATTETGLPVKVKIRSNR